MMPASVDLETTTVKYLSADNIVVEGTAGTTTGIREGSKALKFDVTTGNQWPSYTLDPDTVKKLVTVYDYVAVDVYMVAANPHKIGVGAEWNDKMVEVQPNEWTTLVYTKEAIVNYNGGTGQSRAIYNDTGNENFTFYFDNLRGVMNADGVAIGVKKDYTDKLNEIKTTLAADSVTLAVKKDGAAVTDGVNGFEFTPATEGEYVVSATFVKANYNDYTVEFTLTVHQTGYVKDDECATGVMKESGGAVMSVNTDPAFVKEGEKSICYTVNVNEGYPKYFIDAESAHIKALLEKYNAISFDVYMDGNNSHDLCVGGGIDAERKAIAPKTWTTVTITKESFTAHNGERIFFNDGVNYEALKLYIDNICGVNV